MKAYEMVYEVPFELYEDWKELMLAKEISEKIFTVLKDSRKKGGE